MEREPSSSFSAPRESSHRDELFMQQDLVFSNSLMDLKNLRKQLYSAAEYFEASYVKSDQKQIVMETLRDYATKAFINTVDHLGSMAYRVNSLLDDKRTEISGADFHLSCLEQRLQSCKEFIDKSGRFQQSLVLKFPKHHKRYILPDDSVTDTSKSRQMHHIRSFSSENEFCHLLKVKDDQATRGTPSPQVRKGQYRSSSPQLFNRPGSFQLPKNASKSIRAPDKQASSPSRFSFIRSGSLLRRSLSPRSSNDKQRYPSEPRRSSSMPVYAERDKKKDMEQYANKSKRLFKALLSMGKPRNDSTLYKFLDEN